MTNRNDKLNVWEAICSIFRFLVFSPIVYIGGLCKSLVNGIKSYAERPPLTNFKKAVHKLVSDIENIIKRLYGDFIRLLKFIYSPIGACIAAGSVFGAFIIGFAADIKKHIKNFARWVKKILSSVSETLAAAFGMPKEEKSIKKLRKQLFFATRELFLNRYMSLVVFLSTFALQTVSFFTTFIGTIIIFDRVHVLAPLIITCVIQGLVFILSNIAKSKKRRLGTRKAMLAVLVVFSIIISYMGLVNTIIPPTDVYEKEYNNYYRAYEEALGKLQDSASENDYAAKINSTLNTIKSEYSDTDRKVIAEYKNAKVIKEYLDQNSSTDDSTKKDNSADTWTDADGTVHQSNSSNQETSSVNSDVYGKKVTEFGKINTKISTIANGIGLVGDIRYTYDNTIFDRGKDYTEPPEITNYNTISEELDIVKNALSSLDITDIDADNPKDIIEQYKELNISNNAGETGKSISDLMIEFNSIVDGYNSTRDSDKDKLDINIEKIVIESVSNMRTGNFEIRSYNRLLEMVAAGESIYQSESGDNSTDTETSGSGVEAEVSENTEKANNYTEGLSLADASDAYLNRYLDEHLSSDNFALNKILTPFNSLYRILLFSNSHPRFSDDVYHAILTEMDRTYDFLEGELTEEELHDVNKAKDDAMKNMCDIYSYPFLGVWKLEGSVPRILFAFIFALFVDGVTILISWWVEKRRESSLYAKTNKDFRPEQEDIMEDTLLSLLLNSMEKTRTEPSAGETGDQASGQAAATAEATSTATGAFVIVPETGASGTSCSSDDLQENKLRELSDSDYNDIRSKLNEFINLFEISPYTVEHGFPKMVKEANLEKSKLDEDSLKQLLTILMVLGHVKCITAYDLELIKGSVIYGTEETDTYKIFDRLKCDDGADLSFLRQQWNRDKDNKELREEYLKELEKVTYEMRNTKYYMISSQFIMWFNDNSSFWSFSSVEPDKEN